MTVVLVVVGVALGAWLLDGGGGFIFGGLVGFLIAEVVKLRRRVREVEGTQVTAERAVGVAKPMTLPEPAEDQQPVPPPTTARPDASPAPVEPKQRPSAQPLVVEAGVPSRAEAPAGVKAPAAYQGPSFGAGARLFDLVKTWATTGNVPVKVGLLISLIGLGFLLGVALEQGWITLTIEARHVAVAFFGLALLVVGWRVRARNAIYGLSLQGGGIAVLYLTTYVAHAVYNLLPASVAAVWVIVITVGAGVLAVSQDSRSLAVLGIIGGFLAPILAYSDARDHVLVFGFYAILTAAIVGVAWFKIWPELNLLGLGFTVGLTAFWLLNIYRQEDWVTTQSLIALLILMYLAIPLLFAVRQPPDIKAWMTSPLVFGLPFVGLGFQSILTDHFEYGSAISALVLAVVHGGFAVIAHRFGKESRILRDAYSALAITFLAIAVPLAFDAQYISIVWALQGTMLVWIGVRHGRWLAVLGGGLLQILAGSFFVSYIIESLPYPEGTTPLINGYFLGAALLAVTGLLTGQMLDSKEDILKDIKDLPWLLPFWGAAWWLLGGLMEIVGQVPEDARLSVSIVFVTVSLGGMALAAPVVRWLRLATLGVLLFPALVLALILTLALQEHPFELNGWAAWIVALAVYYSVLRFREGEFPRVMETMHAVGYWVLAILLGTEVYWQVDQIASGVWPITAALATVLAIVGGTLLARLAVAWPLGAHWRTYLMACAGPVILVLALMVLSTNLVSDGDAAPLTYLPLLNPLELLTVLLLVVALAWKRLADSEEDHPLEDFVGVSWAAGLTITGIVFLTMAVARTVHHWLGVPFQLEAMSSSTTLQASLSIVWGLAGLAGMVVGVRLARRVVWVGGASLMAVVVAKLFLFDLRNTGTVARVVSFLGVGLLLLIVGYFAPVPASAEAPEPQSEGD